MRILLALAACLLLTSCADDDEPCLRAITARADIRGFSGPVRVAVCYFWYCLPVLVDDGECKVGERPHDTPIVVEICRPAADDPNAETFEVQVRAGLTPYYPYEGEAVLSLRVMSEDRRYIDHIALVGSLEPTEIDGASCLGGSFDFGTLTARRSAYPHADPFPYPRPANED